MLVYKILLPKEWEAFESSGRFDGSPFDLESAFVHCSSRSQVASVAQHFFMDEPDLVVLAIDVQALERLVRWEPAPDGQLFPHVYGSIPRTAVIAIHRVAGATRVDETLEAAESSQRA